MILTLDTEKAEGWNEIDAVQLAGWRNSSSQRMGAEGSLFLEDQLNRLLKKGRNNALAEPGFLDELEVLLRA